jgi:hypothetical protein
MGGWLAAVGYAAVTSFGAFVVRVWPAEFEG